MKKRLRVAVVTGSRAEYGLLSPVIDRLNRDPFFDCRLLVTGAHLDRRQGLTVREITADGRRIAARVPLNQRGDDATAVAEAMAEGVRGFSRAYRRLKPRLIILLGDRFEILSAASAALPYRIPIAHLHGGETTEGSWDESVRHAVTKLSHVHFAAAPEYARRLVRMGENPRRVFCVGSPALDRLKELPRLPLATLERELGQRLRSPLIVATFHSETLAPDLGVSACVAMLESLSKLPGTIVFTTPNLDAGGRAIRKIIASFVRRSSGRARLYESLGQRRYYSLLSVADAMIGNSSSGILEAPYFGLPVINIGTRQGGRMRFGPVLEVPRPTAAAISAALRRSLSPSYRTYLNRRSLASGSPSDRIVAILKKIEWDQSLIVKHFHDVE